LTSPRLLTPAEVADLLQISVKTVYKNKRKLCGFYPAGIKVLRFREDVIYGIMEGKPPGALAKRTSVSGQRLNQNIDDYRHGF
jgi:predicted site-specific integrase-resolvase